MNFFEKFFGTEGHHVTATGNMMVCCPFPHKNPDGTTYLETRPSAAVHLKKRVFRCNACNIAMSEVQFYAKYEGIKYGDALQILNANAIDDHSTWERYRENLKQSPSTMELITSLGLESVVDELKLGYKGDGIAFPVFVYDELLDIRTYNPGGDPKVKSEKNARSLILPFDLWRNDDRPTLLCAGEKDMAIARAKGFNAITFTGGENAFPALFKGSFKGKEIYILYDNDEAGKEGAVFVATKLKEAGATPYIVTGHHRVCTERGEDIHDFFQKYGKTAEDLQECLKETAEFTDSEYITAKNKVYPLVTLQQATEGAYTHKIISSRVSVVAVFDDIFKIPEYVTLTKVDDSGKVNTMDVGEVKEWSLGEDNIRDILYLCDSNLKEADVKANLKMLCGIPKNENGVKIEIQSYVNVFKAVVMDEVESEIIEDEQLYKPAELIVYTTEDRLHSGEKYRIYYKAYAHPLQGQRVVGLVTNYEESDASVNRFQVTPSVIESLKCFQGNPFEKMDEIHERAKAFAGVETNKQILWTTELFYHTPLRFRFGGREERAYLEPMIVGESRTGKSQTAKKMLEMLELGVFTSLKTATIAGLIGGSDKTNGGFKTKLGLIPRNHKGAIIIEEFSGGGKDFIKQLTDIRSSNQVRIARVNGNMTAPAMVRMLSISNQPVTANGQTIPLRQYPNGIKVLLDLIGAAEDISRYDFFVLIDEPDEYIYPNAKAKLEAFPKESYMNRVRWIWSRSPEQIILDEPIQNFIIDASKELVREYNSHIKLFGSETWKKLSRVAIACAACCCSMDETGEKLIVKKEHVEWAKQFLVSCYDNPLFRLKEYVDHERKYSDCPQSAVEVLQGLYNRHTTLITQLENATEMSQTQLRNISGLDNEKFSEVMNRLAECYFFTWSGEKIIPSKRFRTALQKINRNTYVLKVGAE